MSGSPKISIIIPLYNKRDYITGCLRSVLSQDYRDIEVVVVDDGSTDGSADEVSAIADPRLRVVSIPNSGVANARDVGIENARGEYLLFVDADDHVAPGYLDDLAATVAADSGIDLIIFGLTKVYPDGRKTALAPSYDGIVPKADYLGSFMAEMAAKEGIYGYVPNKMVRRRLVMDGGIRFNPKHKLAEDLDFWLSVYDAAGTTCFLANVGYQYRQSVANSSFLLSGQSRNVIEIWLKCHRVTSKYNPGNDGLIAQRIWGQFGAIFLEMAPLGLGAVKSELKWVAGVIADNRFLTRDSRPMSPLLSLIKSNKPLAVYIYLKLRQLYHRLRYA
jgi:glycosyltransferase involved in cell wall biosynthesis